MLIPVSQLLKWTDQTAVSRTVGAIRPFTAFLPCECILVKQHTDGDTRVHNYSVSPSVDQLRIASGFGAYLRRWTLLSVSADTRHRRKSVVHQ